MERPGADSEEKREPVGDIDIAVVDSLKVLDPNRPIREAGIRRRRGHAGFVSQGAKCTIAIAIRLHRRTKFAE